MSESIQPRYRVLIVDDNRDAAVMLRKFLEMQDFQARAVTDSAKALEHIAEFRPHFILLDIAMPGLTGYDLCKLIRQRPALMYVPIIALSGYSDAAHASMSLQAGCDFHLAKPLDIKLFRQIISQIVEKHGPDLDSLYAKS